MKKKLLSLVFFSILLISCNAETITENTNVESSNSLQDSVTNTDSVNSVETNNISASSVNYYEKLLPYLPDEGKKKVYEISDGDDPTFYIALSRDVIPYTTNVTVLVNEQGSNECNTWFSLDVIDELGTVHSLSNEEYTPQELSEMAEMVYQGLDESGVLLARTSLMSCDKLPFFLHDYDLRN